MNWQSRELDIPVYHCAHRKRVRGKHTSGVFGKVFVWAAGMLAVPIRLQYRSCAAMYFTDEAIQKAISRATSELCYSAL